MRYSREFISGQVRKAAGALEPWLQNSIEGKVDVHGGKLVIPLDHLYQEDDISFARLKGNDRIVVEVLKSCTDKNKEKSLDLHLCLTCKHHKGGALPYNYCDHACMD